MAQPQSPEHRMVETNGIRLHVAEMGQGPAVVFCHGWPETSYSWRHQLPALAGAGFRALAPDMRGYGRSDAPEPIEAYTLLHIVGDMVGLLDALKIPEAVIVGPDWGAPGARRRPARQHVRRENAVPLVERAGSRGICRKLPPQRISRRIQLVPQHSPQLAADGALHPRGDPPAFDVHRRRARRRAAHAGD